jgi:hypothetical protein
MRAFRELSLSDPADKESSMEDTEEAPLAVALSEFALRPAGHSLWIERASNHSPRTQMRTLVESCSIKSSTSQSRSSRVRCDGNRKWLHCSASRAHVFVGDSAESRLLSPSSWRPDRAGQWGRLMRVCMHAVELHACTVALPSPSAHFACARDWKCRLPGLGQEHPCPPHPEGATWVSLSGHCE